MNAAIIAIGGELVNGHTLDTNSQWIATHLENLGFNVQLHINIADREEDIVNAVRYAMRHCRVLVLSGGLGPTQDDVTKLALCRVWGCTMEPREAYRLHLEQLYIKRNKPVPENLGIQYTFPAIARLISNELGTAPGLYIGQDDHHLIALPGVPFEMKHIWVREVEPLLQEHFPAQKLLRHHFEVALVGEVYIEERLTALRMQYPDLYFSYLPFYGSVDFSITATRPGFDAVVFNGVVRDIRRLLEPYIYSESSESIAAAVIRLLQKHTLSIGCAESCSGGFIGHQLTNVPGASEVYLGSLNTYSISAKINILGVPADLISVHTATSREVAEVMAQRAHIVFGSDIGISTTGYIETSEEQPVAFVHTAITNGRELEHHLITLPYDRDANKQYLANRLLFYTYAFIRKYAIAGGAGF